MSDEPIYKVTFLQNDKVYELYARYLCEETLVGFIEIEELIFTGESSVVVDPSEERLKTEFKGVQRCYLPMHTILRIDEVIKEGVAKVSDAGTPQTNVRQFPGAYQNLHDRNNSSDD